MSKLGEYLRSWRKNGFTLSLYTLGYSDTQHKERLGYKLTHKGQVIFSGTDLYCSPMHGIDSDASAAACLSFLSLRPGDTDAEYFESYTPAQLDFAERYGEELSLWSMELDERNGGN